MDDINASSDTVLLSLVQEGNQLAFRQIYHKYWRGLYIYSHNILNDKWLAEDVLHEVFVQIWIRREKSEISNLKSYLFNAVRNRSLLTLRKEKFSALDENLITKLELAPDIENQLNKSDTVLAIEHAALKLPERCRAIFYMNKFQQYSAEEIANHFNISQRTVENQISLALKHLRSELGTTLFLMLFCSSA